jgi:hypothetical protein
MPGTEFAVATAGIGATAMTMILSKLRCFCKESSDGTCARGCGFTTHSLFDQNEVQLEKATINGVEVIYMKQPSRPAKSPSEDGDSADESH